MTESNVMRMARLAAEKVATWSGAKQEWARRQLMTGKSTMHEPMCQKCRTTLMQHRCGMGACVDYCPKCDGLSTTATLAKERGGS